MKKYTVFVLIVVSIMLVGVGAYIVISGDINVAEGSEIHDIYMPFITHEIQYRVIGPPQPPIPGTVCWWPNIWEPYPPCWCELLPWEPADFVPWGCPGSNMIFDPILIEQRLLEMAQSR